MEGAQKVARVEVLEKEQLGVASLSKDHLETSNAVAAFKESRRQSQMAERSPTQQQTVVNNPSYIRANPGPQLRCSAPHSSPPLSG